MTLVESFYFKNIFNFFKMIFIVVLIRSYQLKFIGHSTMELNFPSGVIVVPVTVKVSLVSVVSERYWNKNNRSFPILSMGLYKQANGLIFLLQFPLKLILMNRNHRFMSETTFHSGLQLERKISIKEESYLEILWQNITTNLFEYGLNRCFQISEQSIVKLSLQCYWTLLSPFKNEFQHFPHKRELKD